MSFGETDSSMSLPSRKTQRLLPKSVFDRPGSDRWNLASTTFPDAGPMVRIRFPSSAEFANHRFLSSRQAITCAGTYQRLQGCPVAADTAIWHRKVRDNGR